MNPSFLLRAFVEFFWKYIYHRNVGNFPQRIEATSLPIGHKFSDFNLKFSFLNSDKKMKIEQCIYQNNAS